MEVSPSPRNATTSDDRVGSVRIPLTRKKEGERKRKSGTEGEQGARNARAVRRGRGRIRRDEGEMGKVEEAREDKARSYYGAHTSWLTMQSGEPKS